jgi:broad specificity phosphatase PhoE
LIPLYSLNMTKIYLVRHASPDLTLKDIPYDIHPGPPLSPKGEKESEALAEFLKAQGIVKLYYSPFARSARTAQIISARSEILCVEEKRLAEGRGVDEMGDKVTERMSFVFKDIARESALIGPIGLVSHGGPIALLLLALGIEQDKLSVFKKKFDGSNPLPPAGVWAAEWNEEDKTWDLKLAFTPAMEEEVH